MIKLVAFDWNGTILSDTAACLEAVNEVLKLCNVAPATLNSYRDTFDVPVTKTYLGLGVSEEQIKRNSAKLVNTFHTNYEIRASRVRSRSFAKKLLGWLSENNIEAIIFSNHIDNQLKCSLKD